VPAGHSPGCNLEQRNGKQPGDPEKLAQALVRLAGEAIPPLRFLAGAIAVKTADDKLANARGAESLAATLGEHRWRLRRCEHRRHIESDEIAAR
jgi:hypothetical protein